MKINSAIIHRKKVFKQKIMHINQDPKTKFQKAPLEKKTKSYGLPKSFLKSLKQLKTPKTLFFVFFVMKFRMSSLVSNYGQIFHYV